MFWVIFKHRSFVFILSFRVAFNRNEFEQRNCFPAQSRNDGLANTSEALNKIIYRVQKYIFEVICWRQFRTMQVQLGLQIKA